VPERSVQRITPTAPDTGEAWPDPWPRPARLLPRPEPIETLALLPDHPPVSFTWRGIRRRVKCADGPERVFGEWWKRDAELSAVRDYFRVEDEAGERFWILPRRRWRGRPAFRDASLPRSSTKRRVESGATRMRTP
jgi:protein ImuB